MKNSLWVLLYLLLLILIVFFEYKKSDTKPLNSSIYNYKIKENKALEELFLSYTNSSNIDFDIDSQWGIAKKKKKIAEKKTTKESNVTKQVKVTLKEKTLCIEQDCFKLLGLFQKEKQHYASFYNKNSKKKVEVFSEGEVLKASVQIKNIKNNYIIFSDINSTREWSIHLFDVNSSKYKPKEFE